jgi:hypothetical protein
MIDDLRLFNYALDPAQIAMLFHGPDFNQDGTVNASNYTVWQNNSGLIFSRADFDF